MLRTVLLERKRPYDYCFLYKKYTLIQRRSIPRPNAPHYPNPIYPERNLYLPLLRRLRGLYPRHIRRRPRHVRLDLRHLIRSWRLLNLLLSWHPSKPVKEQGRKDVEDDECPHDPKIPPAVFIMAAQLRQIHIRVARGAKFALVCCIWVC